MKTPLSAETRRNAYETDSRWSVKVILRLVTTLFAFLGFVLFAAVTSLTNENFVFAGDGDWTDGMAIAPTLLSFIYNPVVLAVIFFARSGRAIHPAWHLGFDFVIWAVSVPALTFAVWGGLFWAWEPTIFLADGTPNCDPFVGNPFAEPCIPVLYKIGKEEIAASVFLFLVLMMHFTLFVMACIDVHRLRKNSKLAVIERRNIELQYHRSPDEHMAHQPPAYTPPVGNAGVKAEEEGSTVKYQ